MSNPFGGLETCEDKSAFFHQDLIPFSAFFSLYSLTFLSKVYCFLLSLLSLEYCQSVSVHDSALIAECDGVGWVIPQNALQLGLTTQCSLAA